MPAKTIIESERLILRTWQAEDAATYFQINQDPKVLEFLPGLLDLQSVNSFIRIMNIQQANKGYTLWATELKATHELIGFIGLSEVNFSAHFTPSVELAWRLGSQYWNQGYATEGARASLDYAFNQCALQKIVAFTVPGNFRSIKVMEK